MNAARIRGHYRIDSAGRVEAMEDVNGLAMKAQSLSSVISSRRSSRLVRLSVAGFAAMAIGVGAILALPQIQQLLIAAESAQFASVRHLHGHHLHEVGDKLLSRGAPWLNER